MDDNKFNQPAPPNQYAQPQQPPQYAQPQQPPQYTQPPQYGNAYQQPGVPGVQTIIIKNEPTGNGLGVAALVFGIIAIIGCWIPFFNVISFIFAILAFIFAICGLIYGIVKKRTKGTAIAGLVLSLISILIVIAMYSIL